MLRLWLWSLCQWWVSFYLEAFQNFCWGMHKKQTLKIFERENYNVRLFSFFFSLHFVGVERFPPTLQGKKQFLAIVSMVGKVRVFWHRLYEGLPCRKWWRHRWLINLLFCFTQPLPPPLTPRLWNDTRREIGHSLRHTKDVKSKAVFIHNPQGIN